METFTFKNQKAADRALESFLADGFAYSFGITPYRGEKDWMVYKSNDVADYRKFLASH